MRKLFASTIALALSVFMLVTPVLGEIRELTEAELSAVNSRDGSAGITMEGNFVGKVTYDGSTAYVSAVGYGSSLNYYLGDGYIDDNMYMVDAFIVPNVIEQGYVGEMTGTIAFLIPKGTAVTQIRVNGEKESPTVNESSWFYHDDEVTTIVLITDKADIEDFNKDTFKPITAAPSAEAPAAPAPAPEPAPAPAPEPAPAPAQQPEQAPTAPAKAQAPTTAPKYQTTGYVNVRTEPNTSCAVIGVASKGDGVSVIEKTGNWYKVNYAGKTGYISASYIKENIPVDTSKAVEKTVNVGALNVRSSADLGNNVFGVVKNGDTVSVLEVVKGWAKIAYNNGYGYVDNSYLK